MENMVEVRDKIGAIPALEHRLAGLEERLRQAEYEAHQLLLRYDKERRDVEKIQKESLSAFALRVIGKYEDRVEKEIREELEAKAAYDERVVHGEDLRWEIGKLREKIDGLYRLSEEYRAALERRKALLQQLSAPDGERYRALEEERRQIISQMTEVEEAAGVAERAFDAARRALKSLHKAEGWATFDMWSRGGLMSHMAKYSHVDEAEQTFGHLSYLLQELRTELADVRGIQIPQLIQISSGQRSMDYWFDNIFTDHAVRNKIQENVLRVEQLVNQIYDVGMSLKRSREELEQRLSLNQKREEDLLVSL